MQIGIKFIFENCLTSYITPCFRHFTIRTSNAPVYPSMERTNSPTEIVQVVSEEGDVESDPANSQQIIGHERMVDNEVALLVEPAKGPSFDANSELVVR